MKWNALALLFVLVGCSSQAVPTLSADPAAWQSYGEERATGGYIVQSEKKLAEYSISGDVSSEQYQAYLDGYKVGKASYCEQDARMLARTGKPYRGICDDVNPFFRNDYMNYRHESI
ncbi:DUF2799 domain-containing protein [Vibrio fluminensis]|uniref:DUF2799 domain-containing protein n=1 Tax=Vibrio fluminensis TaxID=2783614 RepID=UPI001886DB8E|nr:DUF2799 domain-containing protein [Vibrio fluminensis]